LPAFDEEARFADGFGDEREVSDACFSEVGIRIAPLAVVDSGPLCEAVSDRDASLGLPEEILSTAIGEGVPSKTGAFVGARRVS
jgi:hypothetical protein